MKLALGLGTLVVGMVVGGYAYLPALGAGQAAPMCNGSCSPATQAGNLVVNPGGQVDVDAPAVAPPVDVANKKCLIENKDDVVAGVTCTYEGKIYHFCCKDCIPTFKADPAKYIKDLTEHPEKYGVKQ